MADDRTSPSDIEAEVQAESGVLRPEPARGQNLCLSLLPTLDSVRQSCIVDLGLRPYRLYLVHWAWPSKRGLGRPIEIVRRELTPCPRVSSMDGTVLAVAAFGRLEGGGIRVDKISARYSEDDLMGRTPDLRDSVHPRTSANNVEFFWEVVENRQTTPPPRARRFIPSAAPHLSRAGMSWSIMLNKQDSTFDLDPESAS